MSDELNKKLIVNNDENTVTSKITKEMDKTKVELLEICKCLGFTKYKSKNKSQLVELIQSKNADFKTVKISKPVIVIDTPKKYLKPLIKWSGGKGDEIKQFEKYLPAEYDTYIEPFIGGGALFFYLEPEKSVICDVHVELVDLYRCVGEGKSDEIYKFMEAHPNDEETYYNVRDTMIVSNPLDVASRFYYQRKTCFRGMLRYNKHGKFNIPFGKYKTINYSDIQNKKYEILLSKTEILNNSFEHVFENYNNENNFMFLDPPYDSEFTDYGYCQFGKEEQKKLASLFKETKIKCLMVIGKTDFIVDLYKDYIVDEYEKKYKFKLYAGRVGDEINTKHLIIKNY